MEGLGVLAFLGIIVLWTKVRRLERLLRENGIRPVGSKELGQRLAQEIGNTVTLSLYDNPGNISGPCKVLDADQQWVLLLTKPGKKQEQQVLIRLDSIKQVNVK